MKGRNTMTDTTTLERTDQSATTILEHWVRGAAWAGESERTGSVFNPALGTVQKQVRFASKADVGAAVPDPGKAWDSSSAYSTVDKRIVSAGEDGKRVLVRLRDHDRTKTHDLIVKEFHN